MNPPDTNSDEAFCVQEISRQVMAMPLGRAARFLNGFLRICGEAPEVADLRNAYVNLSGAVVKLEQIGGELALPVERRAA